MPDPVPAPPPAPAGEQLDEVALGGTPAGRAANTALRGFSKAARAFTLYDSQNEAVRRFLQEYREAMSAFLTAHGALDLEVRSFELALRGEVVHSEKDREKSLAYRLYRDGIRRLTIAPGATWDELLKLLEVLSVRFIGVRQQEEDVVTLLTRAAFQHITFGASSGLVAEKEDEAEPEPAQRKKAARAFPPDFDGPLPPILPPRQFGHFEIPPLALAEFEEEEGPQALPGNAVRMVRELLDDANPEELKTLIPAVEEVRDFLLAELEIKHLRDLARVVSGQHGRAAGVLGPALKPLAHPHTLQKLLSTVPEGESAPDALVELLDLLSRYGADLFDPLFDRLGNAIAKATHKTDPVLETLALRAAKGKKDRILERLATSEPALAEVLLKFLKQLDPAALSEAFKPLSENIAAQHLAVKLIEERYDEKAEGQLIGMVNAENEDVRIAAAEALAKRKVAKAFNAVKDLVELREAELGERESEAMGAALAQIDAKKAFELFDSWAHPPQAKGGLLGKLVGKKAKRMLLWTAACGLVGVPGEPTLLLLRDIQKQGEAQNDEDLKKRCLKSIAFWRKAGQPRG